MKKRVTTLVVASITLMQAFAQEATNTAETSVKELGFKYAPEKSKLEIVLDKAAEFEKTEVKENKQVIIEIKNASISKKWARRIDTSQQKSSIAMVSPYQVGDKVRIVLQMKEDAQVDVSQDGATITASIDNGTVETAADVKPDAVANEEAPPQQSQAEPSTASTVAADGAQDNVGIEQFFESQKSKSYVGKKISLHVTDIDVSEAFQAISDASDFNIVLSDEVKGKITLGLNDVPWDQALDLILHSQKLAAEKRGNILRVTTLEALTKEKEAEAAAIKATEAAEPLVVKIFPISYAKIDDLKTILSDFLSRQAAQAAAAGAAAGVSSASATPRGSIQIDARTNSLVVRDTPSTMEKVKRIIKELDTQMPQILIEAKFVEVSEQNSSALEGRIYATSRELSGDPGSYTFNQTRSNFGALFGGGGFTSLDATGFAVSPAAGGASFGFAPKTALLPGIREIGALISILESESKAKVIASPRIVTMNKEKAEIAQGQDITIAIPSTTTSVGGFQTISATLKLEVTPQVTNDGAVSMKLAFSQAAPGTSVPGATLTVDTKKVDTNVIVDSGATIVIGGVYTSTNNESESGIPVLRNLPIIGFLFGSKTKLLKKSELFIFLTPRVVNEKEAGMRG